MAAIDYSVCVHSDAFVTTQGGNFPHFLMGHRRYLYAGHSRTIKPDKRKLAILFDNPRIGYDVVPCIYFYVLFFQAVQHFLRYKLHVDSQFSLYLCRWKSLKRHLLNMRTHSDAKGVEMKRPIESIYTFPCPNCMCRLNRTENSKHNQTRQHLKCHFSGLTLFFLASWYNWFWFITSVSITLSHHCTVTHSFPVTVFFFVLESQSILELRTNNTFAHQHSTNRSDTCRAVVVVSEISTSLMQY